MPSPLPRWDPLGAVARLAQRRRPSPVFRRVGSRISLFEACSAFTHVTACMLARSPKATLYTKGFGRFVTSTTAPIATGWSDQLPGGNLHPLKIGAFARRTKPGAVQHEARRCVAGGRYGRGISGISPVGSTPAGRCLAEAVAKGKLPVETLDQLRNALKREKRYRVKDIG